MNKDTQHYKYLVTINSPIEKGFSHDVIKSKLNSLKGLKYYIMSDEIGKTEQTYHTHIYFVYENQKRFSTIQRLFEGQAHIDAAKGSSAQNKAYVLKTGKWADTEKEDTKIDGTQEEYGELPNDNGSRNYNPALQFLYNKIVEGRSTFELIRDYPEYLLNITDIDRVRTIILQEQYRNVFRQIECTYIYGKTNTGKTRYVMDTFGYNNVFRITDYAHPFDSYKTEHVLLFDEFSSSLPIQQMLMYCDGYPVELKARYSNKFCCAEKIYFTTNLPLEQQYTNIQCEQPGIWEAFLRRINKIMFFESSDNIISFDSVEDYFNRKTSFVCLSDNIDNPFT